MTSPLTRRWFRRRETTVADTNGNGSGAVRVPTAILWPLVALALAGVGGSGVAMLGGSNANAQVESHATQIGILDARMKAVESRLDRIDEKLDRLLERTRP